MTRRNSTEGRPYRLQQREDEAHFSVPEAGQGERCQARPVDGRDAGARLEHRPQLWVCADIRTCGRGVDTRTDGSPVIFPSTRAPTPRRHADYHLICPLLTGDDSVYHVIVLRIQWLVHDHTFFLRVCTLITCRSVVVVVVVHASVDDVDEPRGNERRSRPPAASEGDPPTVRVFV